ncbi:sodium/hydrogen exchanger 8 isoform X5 [Balaenoptera musculus]|uniref:Sodium/hydrogen exchanger n=1 Tax=Balaenoptera musculus TaxID=9771 RepID=A0A8B8V889_BALMU|nr:sodium/hydrogen exchanger 8 isoform X5 [Balaenoptera musculus]
MVLACGRLLGKRFPNTTHEGFNVTLHTTLVVTTKLVRPTPAKPILPVQTGEQAQQEEQSSGMTIFFSLLVLAICIILVHLLIRYRLHFLPESVAVVSLGILMGAVIKIIEFKKLANWKEEEMFRPNMFFLLLLPPIIFESGYSLHKGNFFQNIGSITLFAVFGTAISAFVVGGGIYFLGQGFFFCVCVFVCFILQADVISKLNMTDSFAFGSLISAVDPVATIAIFNALHVDPVLNMLVFGESILNDAVSIVLTNTAEGLTRKNMSDVSGWQTFLQALGYFLKMFFGSAALGTLTGLISALVLKHIDLRKTPSLEFGMMIIFAYLPYGLAEGISLSGIMAILFSGIVMSHYTHHNLSPVTQILMQQTLRTVAFLCETCVFAFLGLSIFSFPHKFEISFVIWCIVLVLFGRAVNIFPLSYLLNFFRDHKITPKMMFIMWFSGLRGAIPYALSLHLDLEPMEKRQLIGTTTISIVLFTILLLGGSTMPLIRFADIEDARARRRNKKDVNLSKTEKMDLHHGRIQMKTLTNKWYEEVRQGPSGSEDDEQELL